MGPYSGKSSLALVGASAPHPAAPQPRTLPPRPPGRGPRARARVAEPGGLAREGRSHGPRSSFPGGGGGAATPPTRGGRAAQALTDGRSPQFARVGAVGVGMFYGFTKLQVLRLTTPSKKH